MATKTLYFLGTTAVTPNWWGNMQDGGSAPTAANSAFGWGPAKTSTATPFWRARLGATATGSDAASASSFISGASGPTKGTGSGAATAGDSFVAGPYTGTFAAGAWTLSPMLRAGTAGAVGHLNMRVWRSVNADGSSATELTSGSLVGTAVTLSTTADVNGMGTTTWSPGAITLNNEYLFFQVEWQETTAGTSNSDNVFFRINTALITTPNFVTAWAGAATLAPAGGLLVKENQWFATAAALQPAANLLPVGFRIDATAALVSEDLLAVNANLWLAAQAALIPEAILTANATVSHGGVAWTGPTSGLISRWPLDLADLSSGQDADVVGGIGITESGTITSVAGPSGAANAARSFDGSTGYGTFASSPLPASGAYTVSLWGLNNTPTLAALAYTAVNFGSNSGGNTLRLAEENGSGGGTVGGFEWHAEPGAVINCSSPSAPFLGSVWAHIALTFDGASTFQTVVNGVVVATVTDNMGAATAGVDLIGARSSSTAFWNGAIAQLCVYNRVLSSSELLQLYNADAPGVTAWTGAAALAPAGGLLVKEDQWFVTAAAWTPAGSLGADLQKLSTAPFTTGIYDETGTTGTLALLANSWTELEFGLRLDLGNLATGDVLTFEVYRGGVATLDFYDVVPQITVAAHALSGVALLAPTTGLVADAQPGGKTIGALLVDTSTLVVAETARLVTSAVLAPTTALSGVAGQRIPETAALLPVAAFAVTETQRLAAQSAAAVAAAATVTETLRLAAQSTLAPASLLGVAENQRLLGQITPWAVAAAFTASAAARLPISIGLAPTPLLAVTEQQRLADSAVLQPSLTTSAVAGQLIPNSAALTASATSVVTEAMQLAAPALLAPASVLGASLTQLAGGTAWQGVALLAPSTLATVKENQWFAAAAALSPTTVFGADVRRFIPTVATLTPLATIAANALQQSMAAAGLAPTTALVATASQIQLATVGLAPNATAGATFVGITSWQGAAFLLPTAALSVVEAQRLLIAATVAPTTVLTVLANQLRPLQASLTAATALVTTEFVRAQPLAGLAPATALAAVGNALQLGAAGLAPAAVLTAAAGTLRPAVAILAPVSVLAVSENQRLAAPATLTPAAVVVATTTQLQQAATGLSASATLGANFVGVTTWQGSALLSPTTLLIVTEAVREATAATLTPSSIVVAVATALSQAKAVLAPAAALIPTEGLRIPEAAAFAPAASFASLSSQRYAAALTAVAAAALAVTERQQLNALSGLAPTATLGANFTGVSTWQGSALLLPTAVLSATAALSLQVGATLAPLSGFAANAGVLRAAAAALAATTSLTVGGLAASATAALATTTAFGSLSAQRLAATVSWPAAALLAPRETARLTGATQFAASTTFTISIAGAGLSAGLNPAVGLTVAAPQTVVGAFVSSATATALRAFGALAETTNAALVGQSIVAASASQMIPVATGLAAAGVFGSSSAQRAAAAALLAPTSTLFGLLGIPYTIAAGLSASLLFSGSINVRPNFFVELDSFTGLTVRTLSQQAAAAHWIAATVATLKASQVQSADAFLASDVSVDGTAAEAQSARQTLTASLDFRAWLSLIDRQSQINLDSMAWLRPNLSRIHFEEITPSIIAQYKRAQIKGRRPVPAAILGKRSRPAIKGRGIFHTDAIIGKRSRPAIKGRGIFHAIED